MPSWKKVITSGSSAALNSLTVTNGVTGSLFGTASYSTSASQAISSSFANNASSSLFAVSSSQANSSSFAINASSSLFATSASFANNAQTLQGNGANKFVLNEQTSSMTVLSSSFAINASSSLFAVSSSRAVSSSFAVSSSYPLKAVGSSLISTYLNGGTGGSTTGSIFIGNSAGENATGAQHSIYIGLNAGNAASNGSYSNFLGYTAGYNATNANNSNFLGPTAGDSATNAYSSNFFGPNAGQSAINAHYSNFLGQLSGRNSYSASYSTFIGHRVGYNIGTGGAQGVKSNNIIIGTNITLPEGTQDSINLGGIIFATGSYSTTTGNPFSGSMTTGRVGINKVTPTAELDISGSTIITGSLNVSAGITGSLFGTSSYATSASQAISSSFAINASSSLFAVSSSRSVSASFATLAATATTASYATTAQSVLGTITNALTASYVNPLNQNVLITGSLAQGVIGNTVTGTGAHAEGYLTNATGIYSHAEGNTTTALGASSHAEGVGTTARTDYSHAEGEGSVASGSVSHAEGYYTNASGSYSHAEGRLTIAQGYASHAEGSSSVASGIASHAEGTTTVASGNFSHAEGGFTTASNSYAHAEGGQTIASGQYSHAEGTNTTASGQGSHAEGVGNISTGFWSHAEGAYTTASGNYSHAEGYNTITIGSSSHAAGNQTVALGDYQSVIGQFNISSSAQAAFIIGNGTGAGARSNLLYASGSEVQITGSLNVSNGVTGNLTGTASYATSASQATSASFALTAGSVLGTITNANTASNITPAITNAADNRILTANGGGTINGESNLTFDGTILRITGSLIQGSSTGSIASGTGSHAEGYDTLASGDYSHAEGNQTIASSSYAHSEGWRTRAIDQAAHAEGQYTTASGPSSHAEGSDTIALGQASHAEGYGSIAIGYASHAEGYYTSASGNYQTVVGAFNQPLINSSSFIIGNGTGIGSRSNLLYASGSQVQITGSLVVTGGITGSFSGTTTSASYAISASHADVLDGLSANAFVLNSQTSSMAVSSSLFAVSSSRAISSSWATNASKVTVTTNTEAVAFKVPFAGHAGSTTGNYELLQDSETTFTYNPSTNTLIVDNLTGTSSYATTSSRALTASAAPLYLPLAGGTITGNVTVNGTASIGFLNVQYESASVIFSSGSNVFGDATNDTQTLNGTVIVSGSQQITGSLGVNGVIRSVYPPDPGAGAITAELLSFTGSPYGLTFRGYSSGVHSIQNQREADDAEVFALSLQPNGGNVTIGKITSNAKLDVSGSAIISGSLNVLAGITGSLLGTSSYATSASRTITANLATTATNAERTTQNDTGNSGNYYMMMNDAAVGSNGRSYNTSNLSTPLYYNASTETLFAKTFNAASVFTGALTGTASYATSASRAITSSFATTAQTLLGSVTSASYATVASSSLFATTSSYATTAQTLLGSVTSASYATVASSSLFASTASQTNATVTGTNSTDLVYGQMADNDQFRIRIGGTATNAGFVEIATADDGTEPIHVRQYTGVFSTLTRTATLLDGSGNTTFPGSVTGNSFIGPLTGTASYATSASQAISSSFAINASSSLFAVSSSRAVSSSFATLAASATSATTATTASFATLAASASFLNPLNQQTLSLSQTGTGVTMSMNALSAGGCQIQFNPNSTGGSSRINVANGLSSLEFQISSATKAIITTGGAMGLGVTPTNTAGRFEASNDIVAYSSSDKNWKTNIKKINSPLEKISQISGVEFDWIEDEPLHGNKGHDVGVIAQEIELVIPEAVQTRESGMKAVQYDKIIPLLIESIKEQQKQIDELKELVNKLTK